MNEPNPYHPPQEAAGDPGEESTSTSAVHLSRAIPFSGSLSADDIVVWLPITWRSAPRYLVRVVLAILIIGAAAWFVIRSAIEGQRIYPVLYFVAGLIALNSYHVFLTFVQAWFSRGDWKRHLVESKFTRGYFDSDGGCWQTADHVVQFVWSQVHCAFTTETGVSFSFDGQQFFVLPKRFFRSAEDYYELSVALFRHNFPRHAMTINRADFHSYEFQGENCMASEQIESAKLWDHGNWPIADSPDRRIEIDYETCHADWTRSERIEWMRRCLVYFFYVNAPVHLSALVWLAADRYQFGNWNFVWADWQSWLFLACFGLFFGRSTRESLRLYTSALKLDPFRFVFSDTGYFLTQNDSHRKWSTYHSEMKLQADDNTIGWTVDGVLEERLRLRRKAMSKEKADKLVALLQESLEK